MGGEIENAFGPVESRDATDGEKMAAMRMLRAELQRRWDAHTAKGVGVTPNDVKKWLVEILYTPSLQDAIDVAVVGDRVDITMPAVDVDLLQDVIRFARRSEDA